MADAEAIRLFETFFRFISAAASFGEQAPQQ